MCAFMERLPKKPVITSIIPITLAFAAGILWAKIAFVPVVLVWIVLILLAFRLIAQRHGPLITKALLVVFFFMIGGIHATLSTDFKIQQSHAVPMAGREVSVSGILQQAPAIGRENTVLIMKVREMRRNRERVRAAGLVRLTMPGRPPLSLQPGDSFMVRTRLSPPRGPTVPGAFDYRAYLSRQGIRATGWISSPRLLTRINRPLKAGLAGFFSRLRYLPERWRMIIGRRLDELVPRQAGVYRALLIGDRSAVSPGVMENFKACGIVHLLAISGIHMGLLALGVGFVVLWILKRSTWLLLRIPALKVAALISLIPLTVYALIAGFHPPAVRALLMTMVFVAALLMDRQWSIANNTAIAALIILAFKPTLLFAVSFQLSFAAMAAIAVFAGPLRQLAAAPAATAPWWRRNRLWRWSLFSILISLAAMAGTAPIIIADFHRLALISPLATLIVEPLLCLWALAWGILGCLTLPFAPLSALLFKIGALGISAALKITSLLAALPFTLWLPTPYWVQIILWYAALGLLGLWFKRGGWGLLVGVIIIALLALLPVKPSVDGKTRVSFLDVGHGGCSILRLPGAHTIIIDSGRRQRRSARYYDVGRSVVAPFLWYKHISRVDAVIITHPHADHYNGLAFILRRFRPSVLWVNTMVVDEEGFEDLLKLARELKIKLRVAAGGSVLYRDHAVRLRNLLNLAAVEGRRDGGADSDRQRNNQGLVLRLTVGKRAFLFTGDIERRAEEHLIKSVGADELHSDVLKVPHHGSRTSSSMAFIEAVKPAFAVVQAERHGRGIFPAPEVVRRYRQAGAQVLNTAVVGSVFFVTDGQQLRRVGH